MTNPLKSSPGNASFIVRVDSAEEQYAWLLATFGDPSTWSVDGQSYRVDDDGAELEIAEISVSDGSRVQVIFAPALEEKDPFGDHGEIEDRTGLMDELMEKATGFASQNPPHHPGSIARFPIPSVGQAHAITIPMPVLAIDQGQRGLYSPPRMVAIDWVTREPIGVGEFPGFDPENWPPRRLGDWPPLSASSLPQMQLQGMIARFSACWSRILDAWFARELEVTPLLRDDIREALMYRSRLDLPGMIACYDKLNPVFADWLQRSGTDASA